MKRLRRILTCILIFAALAVHAQKPDMRFERITDESGRSLGFITGMMQDTTGFMWISSRNGLYRYDGYNYLEFRADARDSSSLPFNNITNLYYDNAGVLWLKHYDKYVAFSGNRVDTSFQRITDKQYKFSSKIVQDPEGGRWAGPAPKGLYYFPPDGGHSRLFKEAKSLYRKEAYQYLDSMAKSAKTLAQLTQIGNNTDTSVAFTLEKPGYCLVAGVGEMDEYGKYDHARLTDLHDSTFWTMAYPQSKYAGGAAKNRLQMKAMLLKPGTYQLHYKSDNSHAYNAWEDPKPDKVPFYGAQVFVISKAHYHRLNNKLIKSFIPDNTITTKEFRDIYVDRKGNVNVLSKTGLDVYDSNERQFRRVEIDFKKLLHLRNLRSFNINCLYQTRDGIFWIGTSHGLVRFNKNAHTFKVYQNTPAHADVLTNNSVYTILEDRKGRLWIGSNNGLNLMNRNSGDIYHYYSNVKNRLFDNKIIDIYEDRSGNIWVATPEGLNRLKQRRFYFVDLQSEGYTSYPMRVNPEENAIWYRGKQNVLYKYNRTKNSYKKFPLEDRYFSTDRFTGDRLYNFNDLVIGNNNHVWIAIDDKLVLFNESTERAEVMATAKPVKHENDTVDNRFSIIVKQQKYLWLFALNGIYKFDKEAGKIVNFYAFDRDYGEEIYNIDDFVKDVRIHPQGDFWIRTVEGIFRYNPVSRRINSVHRFSEEVRFSSATNGNIHIGPSGKVWIAFLPSIFMYNPESGEEKIFSHEGIGDVGRCNLMADSDTLYWIYTNNGLFRFNAEQNTIKQFTNKNNLADDDINGVVDDGRNNLWITSSKGLTRYDKEEKEFNVVSEEFVSQNFVRINEANFKDKGELMFFTRNGYYSYFPDSINTNKPNVVITSFMLFGEEVQFDSLTYLKRRIVLDYDQNFFTFEFSSLDFTDPTQNKYKYMLEGLDKDWTYVNANNRRAPYTTVPHGKYIFRLKGSNNDGVWAEAETRIVVVIVPPLWKRPWAYVLYVIFAVLAVFLFIRWRERNLKREKRILEHKVAERTEEIERQKEELAKQRDIATQQRDQIAEQKQSITDSIMYARRIQNALLPPEDFIDEILPDHFILNKPRDIVSGDYYWMTQRKEKTYIVVADCTGHGVPGAFMSMLGVAFLNEIVNRPGMHHANDILNELRAYVIKSLHQTGRDNEAKDGMDIAMVILDNEAMQMEYAGAFNPLYLIRDGRLVKVKADRMPIGIYFKKEQEFTNHVLEIISNDMFYIFTDGYVDQFGGDKGRKFMAKNFQQLLLDIHHYPMKEQKRILEETLDDWMEDYNQVDDILVVGVKV